MYSGIKNQLIGQPGSGYQVFKNRLGVRLLILPVDGEFLGYVENHVNHMFERVSEIERIL